MDVHIETDTDTDTNMDIIERKFLLL
jgi:hypothetical protein